MVTNTAFCRYVFYHSSYDSPERLDYECLALVVSGLAYTILEQPSANPEQTTGSHIKRYAIAHNNAGQAVVIGVKMED